MRGSSRAAAVAALSALNRALESTRDWSGLAEELFSAADVVEGNASLRRALADPSRPGEAKAGLSRSLFDSRLSPTAADLVATVAGQRWSADRDLGDALESLAVRTLLARAEREGRIDRVEDELFRFERIVAGDAGLRDALSSRNTDAEGKAGVVDALLDGKSTPETRRLARQAVRVPRGRRLDQVMHLYLDLASRRRDQVSALVTVAAPLTERQSGRLGAALETRYGKRVLLQVVLDPRVIGGIRVQVGDEVVDGTIIRRLDEARRHVAGG
ncbi:MAG: F0F1 ATP synthase subunit delta [Dermatophilaceae bacterium]